MIAVRQPWGRDVCGPLRGGRTGRGSGPAVNASQADYDNDGRLDVIMERGGWENAARLTLLRNAGNGRFEDIHRLRRVGRADRVALGGAGDYDNDGRVDLYVCGEYAASSSSVRLVSDRTG